MPIGTQTNPPLQNITSGRQKISLNKLWKSPNTFLKKSMKLPQRTLGTVKCCQKVKWLYLLSLPLRIESTFILSPNSFFMIFSACGLNFLSHQNRISIDPFLSPASNSLNTATTGITWPPDPPPAAKIFICSLLKIINFCKRSALRNIKNYT